VKLIHEIRYSQRLELYSDKLPPGSDEAGLVRAYWSLELEGRQSVQQRGSEQQVTSVGALFYSTSL